jgi:hypothetical protein
MSFPASPIHRTAPHPTDAVLYLATSNRVLKYRLSSSSVEATFTSPVPEAFAQYLAVASDWLFITGGEKRLVILNAQTLEQVGELSLPQRGIWVNGSWLLRRASAIAYDEASGQIVVADKTGDVYSFPWPIPPETLEKYNNLSSLAPVDAKNPLTKPTDYRFMGTFILSHSSSVVACTLATAPWGRILVTVDRDEHVRISCFPQTWVIAAMGLGHTAFVSCVAEIEGGIVSGGGDQRVIKWDYAGVKKGEYKISRGSCVGLIRPWKDLLVVVGERDLKEFADGDDAASVVEILKTEDLSLVQKVMVPGVILDVALHEDMMFVSILLEGTLVREYRHTTTGFEEVETDRWKSSDSLEMGPKVELHWLESMRKQIGHTDED